MLTTKLLTRLSSPRKNLCVDYGALLPTVAFVPGIPHCIYQPTKAKDKLPPAIAENIEKLKSATPGWSYQLLDNRDIDQFILRHYGQSLLSYYNRYNRIAPGYGAAKADFFRYLLIYRFGEVYLDIIEDAGFRYSVFDGKQGDKPQTPSHTKILPADYRKNSHPLLIHHSPVIQKINEAYLSLLTRTHQ